MSGHLKVAVAAENAETAASEPVAASAGPQRSTPAEVSADQTLLSIRPARRWRWRWWKGKQKDDAICRSLSVWPFGDSVLDRPGGGKAGPGLDLCWDPLTVCISRGGDSEKQFDLVLRSEASCCKLKCWLSAPKGWNNQNVQRRQRRLASKMEVMSAAVLWSSHVHSELCGGWGFIDGDTGGKDIFLRLSSIGVRRHRHSDRVGSRT